MMERRERIGRREEREDRDGGGKENRNGGRKQQKMEGWGEYRKGGNEGGRT